MTSIELSSANAAARINTIGAALHALLVSGRDLIVPYDAEDRTPAYGGATLAPWPNRLIDARYRNPIANQGSRMLQLPVSEPARGHSLHGLIWAADFDLVAHEPCRLLLAADILPSEGYPWHLTITVEYLLSDRGIEQAVEARNHGRDAAPYGAGTHPYLRAGGSAYEEWVLQAPCGQVQLPLGDRLLPGPVVSVDADPARFDFRDARPIGRSRVDHAFTDLIWRETPDGDRTALSLRDPLGGGVRMEWDRSCPWVQLCSRVPEDSRDRAGLAVEPMTCPPDAFNSGVDLVRIAPGATHRAAWRIEALA